MEVDALKTNRDNKEIRHDDDEQNHSNKTTQQKSAENEKDDQTSLPPIPPILIPLEPVPSSNDYTFVMGHDEGLLDILNDTDPSS